MTGEKFIFIINSLDAGGAERSLLEALPYLESRDIESIVVTLRPGTVGFEDELRSAGHDFRTLSARRRLAQVRELRTIIKSEEPNLVYTALFEADVVGRIASIGLDIPVMSNLVNTAYDPVRQEDPNVRAGRLRVVQAIDGFTARHFTDHFHAISETTKDSAQEHLGIDPARVTVIPRGRDITRLGVAREERRNAARRMLGAGATDEVLVSVGRQEYQKGQRILLEAMVPIADARPAARLFIAGREGNSTTNLRELVATLGLGEVVTFLGHRDDVGEVLAAADLFVFPSLYEGLGGAVIEAMALGLAVVASDLAALREVVEDGENGLLVPAGNSDRLAEAALILLADQPLRERFGSRSRSLFEARFDGVRRTAELVDLLVKVAGTTGD